jgi:ATP-binding cassette subfamily F protein uup
MEKREFAALGTEIESLEQEKKSIEESMCSATLTVEQITEQSKRLAQVNEELEVKEMRWLELSEKSE